MYILGVNASPLYSSPWRHLSVSIHKDFTIHCSVPSDICGRVPRWAQTGVPASDCPWRFRAGAGAAPRSLLRPSGSVVCFRFVPSKSSLRLSRHCLSRNARCMLQPLPGSRLSDFGLRKNQDFGQCSAEAAGVGLQPVVILTAAGPAHAYLSQALMRSRLVLSGKVTPQSLRRGTSNELAFWVPYQPRGGTFIC